MHLNFPHRNRKSGRVNRRLLNTAAILILAAFFYTDAAFAGISSPHHFNFLPPVTGKLTTSDGRALEGASISVKGSGTGTFSDQRGEFSIDAKPGDVLVITSVGYEPTEITVGNETTVAVTLKEDKKKLDEVVVTALGIKKQSRVLGYSTTTVDGSKFTQSRETNIGNALTGQVAGVSVAGVATGPAGSSRVLIRGNSSISGNGQPLYVIDNIPYDNGNRGQSGQYGGSDFGDGLSNINPDDIENIQVLKGVAATALYGYRGGNGAILITTKSGARGKNFSVELNNNFTASRVIDERDYQYSYGQGSNGVKPTDAATANNTAEGSWGAKIDGSDAVDIFGKTYKYSAQKNNFSNFFKTGVNNQTSVALSGSSDKGHYRLGLSNLYLNANVPNSDMKQQGLNFNSSYNVTRRLQFGLNMNFVHEYVRNRPSFSDAPANLFSPLLFIANTYDIRKLRPRVDSTRNELLPGSADVYFENPYFLAYDYSNATRRDRLTGGLTLKYNILDWLYVQGQVTRDAYEFSEQQITPNGVSYFNDNGGFIYTQEFFHQEFNGGGSFGINKKFGEDFSLNVNAGTNTQDNVDRTLEVLGGPFVVPYFYSISNISPRNANYSYGHLRVNSLYASGDIGYKNWLFLTVTGRKDWFSQLNPKTNSVFYPSVSGSFIFSDAFKMPSWISFGQLRASYGVSAASGGAGPYSLNLAYGFLGVQSNGQNLGVVNNINGTALIPNKLLQPPTIKEQEIGLNVDFLDKRVGIDMAVYNKNTYKDIVSASVARSTGYTNALLPLGRIRNRGIEFLLTGSPVRTKRFAWNISWNFSYNQNTVLDLGGAESIDFDYARWGYTTIRAVKGKPFGQITGYKYQRNPAGKIMFDANGFPMASSDLEPMGSGVYNKTGGVTNDFRLDHFTLSFLIDYKFGAKIFSGTNLLLYNQGLQKGTLEGREGGYVAKGVTADGQTANAVAVDPQKYWANVAGGDHDIDEQFVYDASFIKFRSLSISYKFPQSVIGNGFIKDVNISLVARNLAILMKHVPNVDPESNYTNTNAQGLELAGYPQVRSFGVNLNVKF